MAEMADPLARLTADDFHRHLHKTFELKAPDGEVVKVQLTAIVASKPALPAALKSHKGEDLGVRSGGAFSLIISTPPPHSPPDATPCRSRSATSAAGAHSPTWS